MSELGLAFFGSVTTVLVLSLVAVRLGLTVFHYFGIRP